MFYKQKKSLENMLNKRGLRISSCRTEIKSLTVNYMFYLHDFFIFSERDKDVESLKN